MRNSPDFVMKVAAEDLQIVVWMRRTAQMIEVGMAWGRPGG